MKNKILSVCVVGAGSVAVNHIKAYKRNAHVKLVAVAAREEEKLKRFCRYFKVNKYYTDYRKMLAAEKPEAVSVCTPPHTHAQISIDALKAGCHVLCEKPIANTLSEADRMIAVSKETNRLLLISFPLRFMKEYMQVKEVIKSGILGQVKIIWFRRGRGLPSQEWYLDKSKSGGVMCELAIHGIDLIRWLSDSPVISVTAEAIDGVYNLGKEDNAWIIVKFKNGAMGVVGSSYSYPFFEADFGVCGDKKALRLFRGKTLIEDLKKRHTLLSTFIRYCMESFILPYRIIMEKPFEREVEHFINCTQGKCNSLLSAENARTNLDIILKALDSVNNGKRIYLNEIGN
ncbi:MAG: Gfo/Idh/MocA family oxidoreductase [Candidatus Omnitrophota bacterium]|nr:Gfo/Idh/MocA family oxidoreductase [Candidatus Omnitrophota bacterium]